MRLKRNTSLQLPISVIIPCYNCSNTIVRAVNSVVNQTLQPKEILLIDDKSSDNTIDFLTELQTNYGANWIKIIRFDANQGPGFARNTGWDNALHPYIAFLDADDSWHPQKLELQFAWMREHEDVDLTSHSYTTVTEQNITHPEILQPVVARTVKPRALLLSNPFYTSTVMVKRSIPHRFDTGKKYSEDYYLWLNMSMDGLKLCVLKITLTYLYKNVYGEGGLSSHLWKMEMGELDNYKDLHKSKKINFFQRLFYSTYSMMKYIRRVILVKLGNAA